MAYGNYQMMKRWAITSCYWYYVKTDPIMDDFRYDGLINWLKPHEHERKPDPDSPTQMIWGDREGQYPDWAKTKDGWKETPK